MQLSIEKLVDPVGYLPGKRCPYPPPHPHLFLLKSLKVLWYIKATSTTDIISLRSCISMNHLTVMAL